MSSCELRYCSNLRSRASLAARVPFLSLNCASASTFAFYIRAAASASSAPAFAAAPLTPPPFFCASTAPTLAPALAAAARTARFCEREKSG